MFANTKACQISPDSDFVFENQALEIGCETTCFVYLAAVAARGCAWSASGENNRMLSMAK